VKRILLVEDDLNVASIVSKGLREDGFQVEIANNGLEGFEKFQQLNPDLVILDIMLPGISGLEVCSRIRAESRVPIIMLTALGTAENVVLGLSTGADDYLIKPFKFIELTARIKSLFRRSENSTPVVSQQPRLHFAGIEMNDETKQVIREGKEIMLTSTEYNLLRMFLLRPNYVYSRAEILENVWGAHYDMGTNVVDVYINYLRKKLESESNQRVIQTVFGMGYVLRES
jgi:two-component system, OmpR family, copper resistance phosphate regulon response regulator CusR